MIVHDQRTIHNRHLVRHRCRIRPESLRRERIYGEAGEYAYQLRCQHSVVLGRVTWLGDAGWLATLSPCGHAIGWRGSEGLAERLLCVAHANLTDCPVCAGVER